MRSMLSRSPVYLCETLGDTSVSGYQHYGGAQQKKNVWDISEIKPYMIGVLSDYWLEQKHIRYHSHCHISLARLHPDMLHVVVPLHVLIQKLAHAELKDLCQVHSLTDLKGSKVEVLKERLLSTECQEHVTIFVPLNRPPPKPMPMPLPLPYHHKLSGPQEGGVHFPPQPLSLDIKNQIIEDFCGELSPERIIENGCAVCGSLTMQQSLLPLVNLNTKFFQPLFRPGEGVTRCERLTSLDPHNEISGPVMLSGCSGICPPCLTALKHGKCPRFVIGKWWMVR